MDRIYLDNSATTKIDPKVLEVMIKSHEYFGNPSSLHSFGQEARKLVDEVRDFVAFFLDCKATEVIFTSGGSESDNLAIKGLVSGIEASFAFGRPSQPISLRSNRHFAQDASSATLPHVVTTAIEHHAVLHTIQDLEKEGKIEATYVKPNSKGIIQVKDIEAAIKENTVLVSVMYVNNETGCVQPIREIGKLIEKINLQRNKKQETSRPSKFQISNFKAQSNNLKLDPRVGPEDDKGFGKIYFHCDAVQAAEYFELGVKYLHVDLLTLTAHKFHGPRGVGVLFVKKGTPIKSQIVGGDQEFKLRAGTENAAGICGLGAAIAEITNFKLQISNKIQNPKSQNIADCHSEANAEESRVRKDLSPCSAHLDGGLAMGRDDSYMRIKYLRDKLEDFILKNIPETYLNGDKENRAPHISNISFKNAEGEAIILNLDFLGIAVSSGSACTSRSLESSHVLSAMGVPHELSHGAIRFSLSKYTTEKEIDKVCEVLPGIIKKLREMSPFK